MKAAAVAAEAGHSVMLFERTKRLGGKTHLAQMLPHRAEFGGIITNLRREMELAKVRIMFGMEVTAALIASESPDSIIIATGARTILPPLEGEAAIAILTSDEVVGDRIEVGNRVLIYDWLADWTGVGLAEKLATLGRDVTLAVNGICAAAAIQNYVRDAAIARLFKLASQNIAVHASLRRRRPIGVFDPHRRTGTCRHREFGHHCDRVSRHAGDGAGR